MKYDKKFCLNVQRKMKNESEHLALEIASTYFLSNNFFVQLHSKLKENPKALSHIWLTLMKAWLSLLHLCS